MNNVLRLWKSNIIIKWQTNMKIIGIQLELIIFSLIRFLFKKVIKLNFFLKKKPKPNWNQFKPTGFGSVFLDKNQFFWFCLVWIRFCSVFSVLLCLDSVRFGFFGFRLIKPKPNRIGQFFQNFKFLIGFFHGSVFSVIFFWFFDFFSHPYIQY
jgi:hypothetical protein